MKKLVWIRNGWRLSYSTREIRRGKNKGRFEVHYKKGYKLKKAIVGIENFSKYTNITT